MTKRSIGHIGYRSLKALTGDVLRGRKDRRLYLDDKVPGWRHVSGSAEEIVGKALDVLLDKSQANGIALIDTMRKGSDYWRPGSLVTKAADCLRCKRNDDTTIVYLRLDELCPLQPILDAFMGTKEMSYKDYWEGITSDLQKLSNAARNTILKTLNYVHELNLIPLITCSDPYIPDFLQWEVPGVAVDWKHRVDNRNLFRECGCHRVPVTVVLAHWLRDEWKTPVHLLGNWRLWAKYSSLHHR